VYILLSPCRTRPSPDLQRFSNTHLPSPPNILVLPLLIPLSSCHAAATYLIAALGGPEQARKIVGGSEWWQVRGLKGIEAEWIGVKRQFKDEENKAAKAHSHGLGGLGKGKGKGKAEDKGENKEMTEEEKHRAYKAEGLDGMRCMLYIHGVSLESYLPRQLSYVLADLSWFTFPQGAYYCQSELADFLSCASTS
jgi:hypothetical protein